MKKYLILFALVIIQGCSSGGDSSPPAVTASTVTAPTSIVGETIKYTITSGAGLFAATGTFTVNISATQNIYTVTGDVVNVADSAGNYTYSANNNIGIVSIVDSVVGVGSFVLTFTSTTSGTFIATIASDTASTQSGTFTRLPAGGSTIPTDPATSFSLLPSNYFTSYDKTINLSGSDKKGTNFTATWSEKTGVTTTFSSVPAFTIDAKYRLTILPAGGFSERFDVVYYSTSANDRHLLGVDRGFTENAASAPTTAIPQTAKIGDSGTIGTYTVIVGDVGNVIVKLWRLEDGGNGKADLIFTRTEKDPTGTITRVETQTYSIDETGNRLSLTYVDFNASVNTTLTLSGN